MSKITRRKNSNILSAIVSSKKTKVDINLKLNAVNSNIGQKPPFKPMHDFVAPKFTKNGVPILNNYGGNSRPSRRGGRKNKSATSNPVKCPLLTRNSTIENSKDKNNIEEVF